MFVCAVASLWPVGGQLRTLQVLPLSRFLVSVPYNLIVSKLSSKAVHFLKKIITFARKTAKTKMTMNIEDQAPEMLGKDEQGRNYELAERR
jgi:hypothetical protein